MTPEERLSIFEAAANFSDSGVSVFAWGKNATWPECEYIDDLIVERAGFSREQFMRDTSCFFADTPTNLAFINQARHRVLLEDASSFVAQLAKVDGESYWLECSARKLTPASDGRLRFALIARNIVKHKRVEEERDLLAAALEQLPAGVIILQLTTGHPLWPSIVFTNEGFNAITGYSREDIASGIYPRILDEQSDIALVSDSTRRVLAGEHVMCEVLLMRKDKTHFWARVRAHKLESQAGYVTLIINDISERRLQLQRLALLGEAVETASEYIILTDTPENAIDVPTVIYANKAFCESLGISQDEILGKRYDHFFSNSNDPKLLTQIENNIRIGRENYRELKMSRKDGSEYWMEFATKTVHSPTGDAFRVTVGRDITLRRRSQNQVSLLLASLDRSANRITLFETDPNDELTIAYQNETASNSDSQQILEFWRNEIKRDNDAYSKLLSGQELTNTYTVVESDGIERIIEFHAHAVPNGKRLDAVLMIERVLSESDGKHDYRSRLLQIARFLRTVSKAPSSSERLAFLKTLLWDAFEATLHLSGPSDTKTLQINVPDRSAAFTFDANRFIVSWPQWLDESALTAMRFCIEAIVEQQYAPSKSTS
ncbi:MAG: PAS domain-containing protein [Vulcanimicrobiaceae bacterium]